MINFLRTPPERFENLKDYPFAAHYVQGITTDEAIRMHYLDEGDPAVKHVFLCLHGEPTWSYLYRKMIPVFVAAGGRVIAPDWVGFGKSDKPVDDRVFSFHFHRNALIKFIQKLDLNNMTLVCHDWGGLLGLTVPMEMPERFSRLIVMNTALATGTHDLGEGFRNWRSYNQAHPDLDVGRLMKKMCPKLSEAEARSYAAPFPDQRYKAGVRMFPNLVPDNPDAEGAELSRRAKRWWREEWKGQAFMAIGMQDPVIPPIAMEKLHSVIAHCHPPLKLEHAGHFVPEDGEAVAKAALHTFQRGGI